MFEVGIVMGSSSDLSIMQNASNILESFKIKHEVKIISAHRTPDLMFEYAKKARVNGLKVIIAGAGGSAHLPGMIASQTTLPVLGVPIPSKYLKGIDSLLSIVQMPKGVPVSTFAIGESGAINAALTAVSILANNDLSLLAKLEEYRQNQVKEVLISQELIDK